MSRNIDSGIGATYFLHGVTAFIISLKIPGCRWKMKMSGIDWKHAQNE
jgi:hypothetical protein